MEMEMAEGRLGRVIALRLKPGTDVLLGLTEACKRAGINNGVILSAIGSLDGVSYCNPVELPTKAGYGYGEVQVSSATMMRATPTCTFI